ncbi:MAG TPA: hypothetical protein VN253_15765 [Kofleriaceae bacterium]|nr:hypothetical protein [Kofleriaceae bacterium]
MTKTWLSALLLAALALGGLGACVVHEGPGPGSVRAAERRDDRRDGYVDAHSPWDKLGERWVNGRVDRDIIHVGRKESRFHKLQIAVEHSALEMYDVRVVFGDGSVYSPPTRLIFEPNTKSRVIDLPGGARVIRRVEFRYGNLPGGGRAQVELWGA